MMENDHVCIKHQGTGLTPPGKNSLSFLAMLFKIFDNAFNTGIIIMGKLIQMIENIKLQEDSKTT